MNVERKSESMERKDIVREALEKSLAYIVEQDFTGHDPYDGINTDWKLLRATKLLRLFLVYFHKFSVINLRPLLGVRKSRQLMTMCMVGSAILLRDERSLGEVELDEVLRGIWLDMKRRSLKNIYGYHCWDAHDFPIQMRGRYTVANTASVVGNQIFGEFLIHYYTRFGDDEVVEYIRDLRALFLEKFLCSYGKHAFFKYKLTDPDSRLTVNASLKGASFVMQSSRLLDDSGADERIMKVAQTAVDLQKPDGRWNYTYDLATSREKPQIDYHQGFVLDDLLSCMQHFGFEEPLLTAYEKGVHFYRTEQFLPTGQGLYRYPRRWPVNIQNQAQGIVTFARAGWLDPGYHRFAHTIAEWTIKNMQDRQGFFYFMKFPVGTNKIPYIRWSDSAMAHALAFLSSTVDTEGAETAGSKMAVG